MRVCARTRSFVALVLGLLAVQRAAATSIVNPSEGDRLPGASKVDPENEMTGAYSKPWLENSAMEAVEAALWGILPSTPSKEELWEPGLLPLNCLKYHASSPSLSPSFDFSVYNITYNDCDTPWVFCRHADAQKSIEEMTDMFGRLPIGMRDLVRTVVGLPSGAPGDENNRWDAFSMDSDVVVRPGGWRLRVLAHEAAHILDSHYSTWPGRPPPYNGPQTGTGGGGSGLGLWVRRRQRLLGQSHNHHHHSKKDDTATVATTTTLYSATERWRAAEKGDAAVASRYSLAGWTEHFAEMAGPGLVEAAGGPGSLAGVMGDGGLRGQADLWVRDWGRRLVAGGLGVGNVTCGARQRPEAAEVVHGVF